MFYICRGEDIFISVWNLHRSPELWDDADKFNPERWPLDGPNPNETNQNFRFSVVVNGLNLFFFPLQVFNSSIFRNTLKTFIKLQKLKGNSFFSVYSFVSEQESS